MCLVRQKHLAVKKHRVDQLDPRFFSIRFKCAFELVRNTHSAVVMLKSNRFDEVSFMARENTQHKLDRVRSPRVQITYDVEIGDAIELKELPFVMGVLGDLTGQPKNPLAALKERKFVEITPDNFDMVLKGMEPHLAYSVANKLSDTGDGAQIKVDLSFESLDDFSPENVAKKIPPLRDLLELRKRLSDLSGSLQGNDKLDEMLLDAVSNTEMRDKLRKEVESRGGTQ
ncbi:MAG: type secretion protein family [Edaphobacter sp.]|nr:type secretion protein family [Edaphobacter sp.]